MSRLRNFSALREVGAAASIKAYLQIIRNNAICGSKTLSELRAMKA